MALITTFSFLLLQLSCGAHMIISITLMQLINWFFTYAAVGCNSMHRIKWISESFELQQNIQRGSLKLVKISVGNNTLKINFKKSFIANFRKKQNFIKR